MLKTFLITHRDEIERESGRLFLERCVPKPAETELVRGIPIVIQQIIDSLPPDSGGREAEITKVAAEHGARLFQLGFTVSEVVSGYEAVCQTSMNLAAKAGISVEAGDFGMLNSVLDVAIAQAVTEYEQLRKQKASEQEVEHLGILAHELRNALSTAIIAREMISTGQVGPTSRTAEVLDQSLMRMRDLIDRELGDVRLRTGAEPVTEHARLADLLDEIATTMRREAEKRGIKYIQDVDHGLEFDTDPQLFISIVSNLIQNAIKYSHAEGRVSLRGYSQDGQIVIEVTDTCGGIPEKKLDTIFKPFLRATTQHPGVGLGLSIVKRAVETLSGHVAVRNIPGEGCSFTVELPLKSDADRAA